MVSSNQSSTVQRLLGEGWTVIPSPNKLVLGGPIIMERTTGNGVDRVAVIPDGEALNND